MAAPIRGGGRGNSGGRLTPAAETGKAHGKIQAEYVFGTVATGGIYTLSCDSATYALTGTAASLNVAHVVSAASGAHTITGTAASLEYGYKLTAASGSYAVAGTTAALTAARIATAEQGTYALTGTAASVFYGREVVADAGAVVVTGQSADLSRTDQAAEEGGGLPGWVLAELLKPVKSNRKYSFTVQSGTTAISGPGAALSVSRSIRTEGSISITASAAALRATRGMPARSGRLEAACAELQLLHVINPVARARRRNAVLEALKLAA